jgi:hypothetical protein
VSNDSRFARFLQKFEPDRPLERENGDFEEVWTDPAAATGS